MGIMQAVGRGRSALQVNITNRTGADSHLTFSPTVASSSCSYTLNSSGAASIDNLRNADVPLSGEWLVSGAAGDYEARVTLVSGTLSSGSATGSWLVLSSTRAWTVSTSQASIGANTKTCTFTVEIRRVSDSVVLDTATITISSDSEMA